MLLQNSSCQHAVINAPVDLGSAHFVRFLPNVSLPHIRAGSASTSDGFGTFSMFICITAYSLADPQNGPLAPRCLRHFITSMPPLGCYRLERKLPGGFTPPLEFCALFHGALRRTLRNTPLVRLQTASDFLILNMNFITPILRLYILGATAQTAPSRKVGDYCPCLDPAHAAI